MPRNELTADEKNLFLKIYKNRLVASRDGRRFYDQIMQIAPNNICLFCGVGTVSELDHFLPKSTFAQFSVLPLNLIPICHQCNQSKLDHYSTKHSEELFHPYFDQINGIPWIEAQLVGNDDTLPVVKFHISSIIKDPLKSKLEFTFDKLKLGNSFSLLAASKLTEQARALQMMAKNGHGSFGADYIQGFFLDLANNSKYRILDRITYKALGESNWFVNGGFRKIT